MAFFYVRSAAAGTANGFNWTNAFTTLGAGVTAAAVANNNTIWIADDHTESLHSGTTITYQFVLGAGVRNYLYCVDHTVASGFGEANLRTTANVSTTNNTTFVWQGSLYAYGINISQNTGGSGTAHFAVAEGDSDSIIFESCTINQLNGGNYNPADGTGPVMIMINCTINTNAPSPLQGIGKVMMIGGSFGSGWSSFTGQLFDDRRAVVDLRGVDLSNMGNISAMFGFANHQGYMNVIDCLLPRDPSAMTWYNGGTPLNTNNDALRAALLNVVRSGTASGIKEYGNLYQDELGQAFTSNSVFRAGGASDGAIGFSWQATSSPFADFAWPFKVPQIGIFNQTTGAPITITVEGVYNGSALPTNLQVWLDIVYPGSATSPLATTISGRANTGLSATTTLTASTQSWIAPARRLNTVYSLGNIVATSNNASRIFFCTTAGTSNTTVEPAGFASATDGSTAITDGTAAFQAGVRFKQSLTFTPQNQSVIMITPNIGAASSVFVIDPVPVTG